MRWTITDTETDLIPVDNGSHIKWIRFETTKKKFNRKRHSGTQLKFAWKIMHCYKPRSVITNMFRSSSTTVYQKTLLWKIIASRHTWRSKIGKICPSQIDKSTENVTPTIVELKHLEFNNISYFNMWVIVRCLELI